MKERKLTIRTSKVESGIPQTANARLSILRTRHEIRYARFRVRMAALEYQNAYLVSSGHRCLRRSKAVELLSKLDP